MAIISTVSDDGSELIIKIEGRFDFSVHQDFRSAYEELKVKPKNYTIDMTQATYLDSSALGMLLLLKDYAGGDSADITILNCSEDVKKILAISNFGQLFNIR